MVILIAGILPSFGQKQRYVELNSIHALAVPENPDYRFEWDITYGVAGSLQVPSTTNFTHNIYWSERTTYHVTVTPVLDSVDCYGESVTLDVIVVDYLSLHTFDDVYFTNINTMVSGDVSENDFDETGSRIDYNPTPVIQPRNGTVELSIDGTFNYTPEPGFVGIDSFVYEAFNSHDIPMFANSKVYIVVKDPSTQANLIVEKTGPKKALFGERITYSILVKNEGPDVAVNVVLKDTLAFGLFNPQYSLGAVPRDWNGNINLGDMNPGDSVMVYIFADISDYSPDKIFNQALVYTETYDPEHLSNDSIWLTEVSQIYVDLPNQIFVPSCETFVMPGSSNSNNEIASYQWIPSTGLNDASLPNPIFTPDINTIDTTTMYVLKVTDTEGFVAMDTTYLYVPAVPEAIITGDTLFIDIGETIVAFGNESIGEGLDYFWYTNNGTIASGLIADSIRLSSIGTYFLQITDQLGCESLDSVVVLYESHPPIVLNDTVKVQAASDSLINVLLNDYDINGFDLTVTNILTEPKNSTYTFDSLGNFTITPDTLFWSVDSLEYEVCNNGIPVQCNSGWIIIDALRPPLNADVEILKSGDNFAFWGDSIEYELTVLSYGPDTATYTTITDIMPEGIYYPEFSLDDGNTWEPWNDTYVYTDSLFPIYTNRIDPIRIKIKAYVSEFANRFTNNAAWVETEIVENRFSNDTAFWTTKIKEAVVADAGEDQVIGVCSDPIALNASNSRGENITYRWTPSLYLDNPADPTPIFTPGETTTYILTVTDDDGITSVDSVTVKVLPPPMADAGPDKYIRLNSTVALDGSGSTPQNSLSYNWETNNGNIISGEGSRAIVDTIGNYTLIVTDETGCIDSDEVEVFQFYYHPFAIPDYYSTRLGRDVNENVLYNDYDPNKMFELAIEPGTFTSDHGGIIVMQENGDFTYSPPTGYVGIDVFTYTVCNNAYPPRCSRGYVEITIKSNTPVANLAITKSAIQSEALMGKKGDVQFHIEVENKGDAVARNVVLTDSLHPLYLADAQFVVGNGSNWRTWDGDYDLGDMNVGEIVEINIRSTAQGSAPGRVFNAATVASETFDNLFDWDDIENRNVDTASVKIRSDLIAVAYLEELYDNRRNDLRIGQCDTLSRLVSMSYSLLGIEFLEWTPRRFLNNPNDSITTFNFEEIPDDTTITFQLLAGVGDNVSIATINVTFSDELIADAGPDRKKNANEDLIIDGTNSQGYMAEYSWYDGHNFLSDFDDENPLTPVVTEPGTYFLYAEDYHGCLATDEVVIRENELFGVVDFIVLLANDTIVANVATNDFDPNGDSVYYTGVIFDQPNHGTLLEVPSNVDRLKSATAINAQIAEDGTFVYVPDKDYLGPDYFTYEVSDDNDPDLRVKGTVYIKVIDVDDTNSPPVANPDYAFVNSGGEITLDILSNDYDFDGGEVEVSNILIQPQKGSLSVDSLGNYHYTPTDGLYGEDFFVYQICDNGIPASCDTSRVIIQINKVVTPNSRPVAIDDAYYAVEKTISGNVLDNDYDIDGYTLAVRRDQISGPYHGTFQMQPDGDFLYTPNDGYEGTDQIVYEVRRQSTDLVAYATIYITCLEEYRYNTDVSITKFGPVNALSGSQITYTLIVSVDGPTLSNDVVLSDTIFNALTNIKYSINGISWNEWDGTYYNEQMMLYENDTIFIRGDLPLVWEYGDLYNTGRVEHDMGENVSDNNTSTVITEIYQSVIANAGTDTIIGACNEVYQLDGTKSVGLSAIKYSWTPAELLDDPTSATPNFTTQPGETTTFTLAVESSYNGYTDSDTTTVTITVGARPIANAGEDLWPDTNDPVTISGRLSTGAQPLEYLWWEIEKDGKIKEWSTEMEFVVERSGDYYLTITDPYGCESTDLMHVGFPIDPFIAIDDTIYTFQQEPVSIFVLKNDIIDKEDDRYDLENVFFPTDFPMHGTVTANILDSSFVYIPEAYYSGPDQFVYAVATIAGFTDEATVYIEVLEKRPLMPTGFSPNGDGINDFLVIENVDLYQENSIIIFNRWGNIVYQKTNYDNSDPWNGVANKGIRIGNGPLPTGVYFYVLNLGDDERIGENIITGSIYIASDNRR